MQTKVIKALKPCCTRCSQSSLLPPSVIIWLQTLNPLPQTLKLPVCLSGPATSRSFYSKPPPVQESKAAERQRWLRVAPGPALWCLNGRPEDQSWCDQKPTERRRTLRCPVPGHAAVRAAHLPCQVCGKQQTEQHYRRACRRPGCSDRWDGEWIHSRNIQPVICVGSSETWQFL